MTTAYYTIVTLRFVFYLLALALAAGCARIQPPPGGAIDSSGPVPVAIVPDSGATHVPLDARIEVLFDSRLQSVSSNIVTISPFPAAGLKVSGSGRRLVIQPQELLHANQTYRLTVSPQLKDERGNPMASPLEIVFSTGDSIARGRLHGVVFDIGNRRGIWIWGWRTDGEWKRRFSAEPMAWSDPPDVVTATDSGGKFVLAGLADGRYRLLAIDDVNQSRRYEPAIDRLGITFDDAFVPADSATLFPFLLAVRDTTPPSILLARMVTPRIATLRFSRAVVPTAGLQPLVYSVGRREFLATTYPDATDSTRWWSVFPAVPDCDTLQLIVENVSDRSGSPVPLQESHKFPAKSTGEDTLTPRVVSLEPPPGWVFGETVWTIRVSHAVTFDAFSAAISARMADSTALHCNLRALNLVTAEIRLTPPPPPRADFELRIATARLVSFTGVTGRDTVLSFRYKRYPDDTTGVIRATIADTWRSGGNILTLEAVPANEAGAASGWIYSHARIAATATAMQTCELATLPGIWRLRFFRDDNRNGVPDIGTQQPFRFAEPVYIIPDTVRVRSRWTIEKPPLFIR